MCTQTRYDKNPNLTEDAKLANLNPKLYINFQTRKPNSVNHSKLDKKNFKLEKFVLTRQNQIQTRKENF